MKIYKKYFVYIVGLMLIFLSSNVSYTYADEVCFSEQSAVDLITLLDASERDLELLGSCQKLVKELYQEIEIRDTKIVTLTDELIQANQQVIRYKEKYQRARKIAWYTTAAGAVIVIVSVLPAL